MAARRILGKPIAAALEAQIAHDVAALTQTTGAAPRLDVVLVGEDPASQVYVSKKTKAAKRVGIDGATHRLPADADQWQVLDRIRTLNRDPNVHGILLQLPLPDHLDKAQLLDRIDVAKDVDCFHPHNLGLMMIDRAPMPSPTPNAIMRVLEHEKVSLAGAEVVIVNHSNLIGKPLAALMINEDASVAVCHKLTKDLAAHCQRADVLVSGTGVAGLIGADHIRPGAVVVDVGFARTPEGNLCGDVDPHAAEDLASAFTPVPGGVGPVTVATLLRNVVSACQIQQEAPAEAR